MLSGSGADLKKSAHLKGIKTARKWHGFDTRSACLDPFLLKRRGTLPVTHDLETRIQRTRALLGNMTSQLRSLRARNKAQRERERRQKKVDEQQAGVDKNFKKLLSEIRDEKNKMKAAKHELVARLRSEGIETDLDVDSESGEMILDQAAISGLNGSDPTAGSSRDKVESTSASKP